MIETFTTYAQPYFWHDATGYSGLVVTIGLLLTSLLIGFILSLPLSILRISHNKWLSNSVWIFTYVFRGTPLYIQLLIIYTGLYQLPIIQFNQILNSFFRNGGNCAVLALALNTTAYTTEIFAGALRSIPAGEVEAARAFGIGRISIYAHLLVPAALRRALPAYSNEVIFMLHSTAIAFTATVPDLMKVAGDVNAETYRSFDAYGIAALIYLCTSLVLIGLFRLLEGRVLAYSKPRKN
ncbi:histidine ABC transporter permease HisM [Rhizobium lusitanum]|uniref:histidine ABC transporter permease HisM n=1 Tax=Rhizobium lusitanum TaxID=293958 RepID=UPI0015735218|nr:histidine ABC transporter permease HisM [Rhizobium lusitanum]NTJ11622.1 ABC transporter permease subunit [Rhizobium lusitanum]